MKLCETATALVLGAAVVLGGVPIASAQMDMDKLENSTPGERAKAQTMMMKSKLSLTPEQTPKVEAINQKYAERMDPVIKGSAGPLVRMREMQEINTQKEAELKQVLSPEQFEKYLASRAEMREQLEERAEEKKGGGR
jgi:hypothetical protein